MSAVVHPLAPGFGDVFASELLKLRTGRAAKRNLIVVFCGCESHHVWLEVTPVRADCGDRRIEYDDLRPYESFRLHPSRLPPFRAGDMPGGCDRVREPAARPRWDRRPAEHTDRGQSHQIQGWCKALEEGRSHCASRRKAQCAMMRELSTGLHGAIPRPAAMRVRIG